MLESVWFIHLNLNHYIFELHCYINYIPRQGHWPYVYVAYLFLENQVVITCIIQSSDSQEHNLYKLIFFVPAIQRMVERAYSATPVCPSPSCSRWR